MKDSNKIKKIDIGFDNSYSKILFDDKEYWKLAELLIDKTNELIDKVNELEAYRNSKKHYEYEDGEWVEYAKLESQPEEPRKECEHEWKKCSVYPQEQHCMESCGYSLNADGTIRKRMDIFPEDKQTIYTSEGDAVGEVEKKCECNCAHRPHLDDCYLNHCPHKEKYEPKKD